jgi:UPF0755 protein
MIEPGTTKKMAKFNLSILLLLFIAGFGAGIFFARPQSLSAQGNISEISEGSAGGSVVFNVARGDSLKNITHELKKQGLITNELLFRIYVFVKGVSGSLQAGDYSLNAAMSFSDIVGKLRSGDTIKIGATIFEGFDIDQVEATLNARFNDPKICGGNCGKKIVLSYFKTKDFKNRFSFLKDAPDDASLEGYLFPDTYKFTSVDDHDSVAREMLKTFEANLSTDILEEIKRQGKTVYEVVTMASLVEKEVRGASDKRMVAGIMMNRLAGGMPLQIDATLAYITDKRTTRFSIDDTKIDSPYNTYVYRGLPKGPICNPGLESILAVVYPKKSDYYFYLSASDGHTVFSKNFQAHLVAKRNYLK